MTVTALFATAGATNSGLYPAAGLCETMAEGGQFPPALGRRFGGRAPAGILVTAAISIVLAVGFDLSSIASIGSAIALLVFTMVSVGHLRVRSDTGASLIVLLIAIASTAIVLLTFAFTTLVEEPATAVTLAAIIILSVVIDVVWKRTRAAARPHDPDGAAAFSWPEKYSSAVFVLVCCSPARSSPCSVRKLRTSAATSKASPGAHFVESSRMRPPSG